MSWNTVLFVGAGIVAIGATLALREHAWLKRAQIVPGTITEMIVSHGSKGRRNFTPRVSFTALDGTTQEFVRGYTSSPPDFAVGDRVSVAYDASSYEGRILSFGQRFGAAAFFVIIGLAAMALAATFIQGRQFVPRIYLSQNRV